ncbi:hypothetical protein [Natrinema halophilum]|uniref:hypothetical protein n=1 Tax=Natrinema halophilum TaxID=1699371 RepID=UPI0031BA03F6
MTTDTIALPTTDHVLVRDSDGTMRATVHPTDGAEFPSDEYILDISGPLKVYADVHSAVRIYSDAERTHVAFDDATQVILGARSFHERPAGTIATTSNPIDVMAAVSAFGSALKTTSPERSYPTLRGHPPRLELGDELRIPDGFERTDTGVRIEVPASLRDVFVIAPLAYYLGADVRSGSSPQIAIDTGFTYALNGDDGFEHNVERVMRQVFFLDCLVRTTGTTQLPLHERKAVESLLEFDFETAYHQPLDERLETYLDVSFTALEPSLPDWQFETRLKPTEEHVEFLPFVANALAVVSVENGSTTTGHRQPAVEEAIEEFTRDEFGHRSLLRTARGNGIVAPSTQSQQRSTLQQAWTGIDGSEIVSTTPLAAYENSIGRTPKDGPLEIAAVCNDQDMLTELENVNNTYGTREELPFEITVHQDLSRDELTEVLATDSDFFHYIGHIDDAGFRCSDGVLDATTLDSVGIQAFLLNACQSHDQGLALVEAGSIGGIVTLQNVVNSGAVSIGSTIAQLLNRGFPLYAALDIARQASVVGQHYVMVGDGRTTIAQAETGVPNACTVTRTTDGLVAEIIMYTSAEIRRGCVFSPYLDPVTTYYVLPRKTGNIRVTEAELMEFFDTGQFPVLLDGTIHWSDDIVSIGR